ncbi:MAG: BrnT family toxin [Chloroflexota bacterium]|nr:BrnT family toxin [Chloroflexota bacterium]
MQPPRIDALEWDDWNRDHIAKHDVSPEEVEEMLATAPVFRRTYKQRFQLLGPTLAGRMLSVIVGANPERHAIFYVFSARPASRSERRIYGDLQEEVDDQ